MSQYTRKRKEKWWGLSGVLLLYFWRGFLGMVFSVWKGTSYSCCRFYRVVVLQALKCCSCCSLNLLCQHIYFSSTVFATLEWHFSYIYIYICIFLFVYQKKRGTSWLKVSLLVIIRLLDGGFYFDNQIRKYLSIPY